MAKLAKEQAKVPLVETRRMALAELLPADYNPRRINDKAMKGLRASLERFGELGGIVYNEQTGRLVGGHQRVKALAALGVVDAEVRVVSIPLAEEKAANLALNHPGIGGEWDEGMLAAVLADVQRDLPTAFDELQLGDLWAEADAVIEQGEVDEDEVPETPANPVTEAGDLWVLGDHRLMCGDSTKSEDVERLMAGVKADLCFTSPPYALGKSVALSGNKAMSARANAYDDHQDTTADWGRLMRSWFSASSIAVRDVWVVNVQPLAGNKRDLMRFIADNVERLVDVATWDKGHAAPQMAAGVMASRYEWMIIFAANNGASRAVPLSSWRGTVQSVYVAPPQRDNQFSEMHAATMPLHVPRWVMQTLCDQSKSIYEPFCGTGTTVIAAEQLGRKCYGMEISPQYCDVIVERWQALTGKAATLDGDGRTFDEVKETRHGATD